jgi:hypothetical protein
MKRARLHARKNHCILTRIRNTPREYTVDFWRSVVLGNHSGKLKHCRSAGRGNSCQC